MTTASEMARDEFLAECETKANEAKSIAEKATPNVQRCRSPQWAEDANGFGIADFDREADRDLFVHARASNPDLADRVLVLVKMVRERDEKIGELSATAGCAMLPWSTP